MECGQRDDCIKTGRGVEGTLPRVPRLSGRGNMVPGGWPVLETVFTTASCPVEELKDLAEGETFPNGPLVETQRAWRSSTGQLGLRVSWSEGWTSSKGN